MPGERRHLSVFFPPLKSHIEGGAVMSSKTGSGSNQSVKSNVIPIKNNCSVKIGAILKEARNKAGLSQRELADMMEVSRNTVINWEADKNKPDYDTLPELCAVLGISITDLFGVQKDTSLSPLEERLISNFRLLTPISRSVVDKMISAMLQEEMNARDKALKTQFRLFEEIPGSVAAGAGNYVPNEPPAYCFLRKNDRNAKADAIIRVSGRSMEPVYHDMDMVYIQYTTAADPGEDVVCSSADGCVIKRVNDDHTLYSLNSTLPYGMKSDDDHVQVFGRVLGIVSSSDQPEKEDAELLEDFFQDEIRDFRKEHHLREWD